MGSPAKRQFWRQISCRANNHRNRVPVLEDNPATLCIYRNGNINRSEITGHLRAIHTNLTRLPLAGGGFGWFTSPAAYSEAISIMQPFASLLTTGEPRLETVCDAATSNSELNVGGSYIVVDSLDSCCLPRQHTPLFVTVTLSAKALTFSPAVH